MIHLFEAIWYAFLVILKVFFIPVLIIVGFAFFFRLIGWISRKSKEKNK